ncbi:MAG: efflux transporter outer membrane subunit [Bacteroidota bacterium]|nr:efflux transporter outer membrane subunit [Bacteroidota bacterium]
MILSQKKSDWVSVITTLLLFTAGCTVGPDFVKPSPPDSTAGYTTKPLSTTDSTANLSGGSAQRFIEDSDISGEWWALFQSKPLNALIELSLKNNPDLKAAQAALTAAQENFLAQRSALYPSAAGNFSASRSKTASEISPTPNSGDVYFSLFTPQVSVSYVPDVFGLYRRTAELFKAQAEQIRFALIAAHITVSANVAAAAIQEASLRAQIDATRQLITINSDMVEILHKQFEKGYVGRLEVAEQESQLAQITATLPPLEKQLAQQRNLLAMLSGNFPNQDLSETFSLSSLQLPQELPESIPSKLVERRPDILQAEENLHAASAQIGIAEANRLPLITLTADIGSMALNPATLFKGGTGIWDMAANATQPIFEGGKLLHQERAAKAAYTQAAEQYRSTVLNAFRNVADVLQALEQDAATLKASADANNAAEMTLDLARKQWQAGYTNYLALLNAEQTYQDAVISLVQARANRYADTAALFFALGGGWWNREDVPKN